MNTAYAAKKPSVSAVNPTSRAMITPTTAARPDCTAIASAVTAPDASDPWPVLAVRLPTDAEAYGARQSTMATDTIWTEPDLDELRREFADVYGRSEERRVGKESRSGWA